MTIDTKTPTTDIAVRGDNLPAKQPQVTYWARPPRRYQYAVSAFGALTLLAMLGAAVVSAGWAIASLTVVTGVSFGSLLVSANRLNRYVPRHMARTSRRTSHR